MKYCKAFLLYSCCWYHFMHFLKKQVRRISPTLFTFLQMILVMAILDVMDRPVCAPSRYCLMTGINSGKAFIRGNDEWNMKKMLWQLPVL